MKVRLQCTSCRPDLAELSKGSPGLTKYGKSFLGRPRAPRKGMSNLHKTFTVFIFFLVNLANLTLNPPQIVFLKVQNES